MKAKRFFILVGTVLGLASCQPEVDYLQPVDYNRIGYQIADNFNLSVFYAGLIRTGVYETLLQDGPYTALVPSNTAFSQAGYGGGGAILAAPAATVSDLVNYHILDADFELDRLPFLFNQEIRTRGGGHLYVTRWIEEQDTVITINGAQVSTMNVPASNGQLLILDKVLSPNVNTNLTNAIANDERLTLFSEALHRSGVAETLRDRGPYTVFAPSNTAMGAYGLGTVQAVNQADPAVLANVVRYHIAEDRRFFNDYRLTTEMHDVVVTVLVDILPPLGWWIPFDFPGKGGQQFGRMLDGNTVTFKVETAIGLEGAPINNFGLVDITNVFVDVIDSDIMAGNGVLHIIDGVLNNGN